MSRFERKCENIVQISSDSDPEESSDYDAEHRDTIALKMLPTRKAERKAALKMCSINPLRGEPLNFEFKQSYPKVPSRRKNCHSCRRTNHLKNVAECFQCNSNFCQRCLSVRHGEDVFEVSKPELQWVCPKCRKGCGAGCEKTCCTCSKCCSFKGSQPRQKRTGKLLIKTAKSAGFCLHDYLIHLQTYESKQEIIKRKSRCGWTKVSSKSTSAKVITELTNDDSSFEQEASYDKISTAGTASCQDEIENFNVKREDFNPPLENMGHNDKMRPETGPNKIEVVPGEKEMDHQEKVGSEDDRLAAIVDLQVDIYLMTLWFGKVKEVSGNTMSITLSDKEVKQKNDIQKRSPARGAADIFNSIFKNQPQDCKELMLKGLKETLRSYLANCNSDVERFYEAIEV